MTLAPVVLHIPHSSRVIPACERSAILLSDEELQLELLRMTDHFTDELFDLPELAAARAVFPLSRLVVDPERFERDEEESMAEIGMGAIYTSTSSKGILRHPPSAAEREALMQAYYHPHHSLLTALVKDCLERFGAALIVDCHSFPDCPLPYELNQDRVRPDICVGSDPFHSPDCLVDAARSSFSKLGYSVALNQPFAGSMVPSEYFGSNQSVRSVMIEVNRKLYMDVDSGEKTEHFHSLAADIHIALRSIYEAFLAQ